MQAPQKSITYLVGVYVSRLLTRSLSNELYFHDLRHTLNVVRGVRNICKHMEFSEEEYEILLLAAWFHDTGHVHTYKGHEAESLKIAQEFLEEKNYPTDKIAQVLDCIAATRMPQQPKNKMQEVICDADLYHLSLPEYPHLQHLLREEWSQVLNQKYTDAEWSILNLSFLNSHHYFTTYGKNVLGGRKALNLFCFIEDDSEE